MNEILDNEKKLTNISSLNADNIINEKNCHIDTKVDEFGNTIYDVSVTIKLSQIPVHLENPIFEILIAIINLFQKTAKDNNKKILLLQETVRYHVDFRGSFILNFKLQEETK